MTRQIKFTVGDGRRGYKTVELTITGATVAYKILRGGLLDVGKKNSPAAEISDEQLAELDALEIFAWEENYSSQAHGGLQWSLTYAAGDKIYRGRGAGTYPENWSRFMDWLDAIVPELEFVNRRRLERVTIAYAAESLTLDRNDKSVTLAKKKSRHIYDAGDDIKKFFDACQKIIDGRDSATPAEISESRAEFEVVRHDGSIETFETYYSENFLPGLTDFADGIRELMADLSAEIFSPQAVVIAPRQGKYILCKVRFPGTYKLYTYRTDDETLAVGDAVDVPVGRNNEVTQARIAEIGYFEEYEAPFPVDRIKKIIGKHIAADWENF